MGKLVKRNSKLISEKPRKRSKPPAVRKISYKDGGEGMIKWCNEAIYVPIYPENSVIAEWIPIGDLPHEIVDATGKSYRYIWEQQGEILRECLAMKGGRFLYRLIIFCWMRGEGKSLLACLIQLWKFFNWSRQQIMLGANSKDQVKFVHFDIMKDIIINSPKLFGAVGGKKNLQEKEIRLKDNAGNIRNMIRSISSFTGIVSNITGYTFSEMFDMKNPRFFTQLDGSIRNIPNALGVIDSTVSAKTHVLYQLYSQFIEGKLKTTYFSYRYSQTGDVVDYWNPHMDQTQLEEYKAKFPFGEYEQYFLNLRSAGTNSVFTPEMIEAVFYHAIDGEMFHQKKMIKELEDKNHRIEVVTDIKKKGMTSGFEDTLVQIDLLYDRMSPVDKLYTIKDRYGMPRMATLDELLKIGDILDTHFAVLAGLDFGDPYAVSGLAQTILTLVAKGLPGSRSKPPYLPDDPAFKYVYFVLHILNVRGHSLDAVKTELDSANDVFDGIDMLCSERYGAWDMEEWCKDRDIGFEPIFPNYDRQREAFKEVLYLTKEGLLKSPFPGTPGTKTENIIKEEMGVFIHNADKRWFGSSEKMEKRGTQDDFMFSLGWGIYGGRMLGHDMFRLRRIASNFGAFYPDPSVQGAYV